MREGRYPTSEYGKPISDRVLWSLRLHMLLWVIVLIVVPCVLITLFLSWGYLLFLILITTLCEFVGLLY